eukprot:gnl/MRDRNA2_/MRDRNA2_46558_c0_seq1.p1 gnl/MRDRNA2_/MRDRNA2_46558_c0~~gnl/MRDRNA2_/MRDRNA2_46558_c0_seq1.p1  ORF type:complete len:169 (-),score=16.43 gnl/MRDRNA2_/MRDRNA2_46558_c0_seq1:20-526(-)
MYAMQMLANTFWAVATLHMIHQPLLDALSAQAIARLSAEVALQNEELSENHQKKMFAQHISSLAWSVAKLECKDVPLRDAIAAASRAPLNFTTMRDLSITAWAFSFLLSQNETLFESISEASINRRSECQPRSLANPAWAFAKLVLKNPNEGVLGSLSSEALVRFNGH